VVRGPTGAPHRPTPSPSPTSRGPAAGEGLILDTIPGPHDITRLLRLLALDGTLSVVGFPSEILLNIMSLTMGRKKLTSSGTGGRRGTAEMLAFAAGHGITADIELLSRSGRGRSHPSRARRLRNRFVLDLSDLDQPSD
jgi:alcohol dehydrogenase (NADP+)